MRDLLRQLEVTHIERIVEHTKLWIRAGPNAEAIERYGAAPAQAAYWFQV